MLLLKRILLAALLLTAGSIPAVAQVTAAQTDPGYVTIQGCPSGLSACFYQYGPGFNISGQATLSTSSVSGNVALPSSGSTVVIINTGAVTSYVKLGTSNTVTATTADTPVLAGQAIVLNAGVNTYIAGITASSTSTLTIQTGTGIPIGAGAITSNSSGATFPAASTPVAGTTHAITTGGTAVTAVTGPVRGCYIVNPLTATDEGIAATEPLFVNPVTTATTTGNNTNTAIQPGQSFNCVPGQTTNVSVNAATNSHAFTVVTW